MSGSVSAQTGGAKDNAAANATGAAASKVTYAQDDVDPNQKKNTNNIGSILRAGKFAGNQTDFDDYYKKYALARWTQLNVLNDLHKYRQELITNLRNAKSGEVHDHLNDLVLEYMSKLIKSDKYHPAVRVNAMLMIGELNVLDSGTLPPLEIALPILLTAVNDPKQIDAIKIAALVGIKRHVTAGVNNPQTQSQILSTMLKLAAPGANNPSNPGQDWMCKRAIEILGLLGNAGNNNQVVQLLTAIINDAKTPYSARSAAADAFGKLKIVNPGGLNAVDLAKTLAQFMLDVCSAELTTANNTNMPVSRRRIKTCLSAAMEGLKNLKQLTKIPAQQTSLNNLQTIFDNLYKDLDKDISKLKDEELDKYNEDLKKSVETCQTKLEDWLKK